jgi:hypothetical protein
LFLDIIAIDCKAYLSLCSSPGNPSKVDAVAKYSLQLSEESRERAISLLVVIAILEESLSFRDLTTHHIPHKCE